MYFYRVQFTAKREEGKDKDKQEKVKGKKKIADEKPNHVAKEGFYFVANQVVKIEVKQVCILLHIFCTIDNE